MDCAAFMYLFQLGCPWRGSSVFSTHFPYSEQAGCGADLQPHALTRAWRRMSLPKLLEHATWS